MHEKSQISKAEFGVLGGGGEMKSRNVFYVEFEKYFHHESFNYDVLKLIKLSRKIGFYCKALNLKSFEVTSF